MPSPLQDFAARPGVRQFARFLAVGAAATALQYAVLLALVELAHAPKVTSSAVGYLCGAVASYLLNRRFTFQSDIAHGKGFAKFMVVNLIGLGLNTLIFSVVLAFGAHYVLAQVTATGLVLIWNYLGARLFVFR